MINFLGYIGSLLMVIFSFTLVINYAIVGLILLTIQAIKLRAYNLVALNLVSVVGFIINKF
jgi:hypothetical protein